MVIHHINPGTNFDSNIFLIIGTRTALIDAGTGKESKRNIAKIKDHLNGRELDMIILTHFHFDHIGGLKDLQKEFDAEVLAGAGDAPFIANGDPEYTLSGWYSDGPAYSTEVTELMEGDVIDMGEHRLRVVNTPGHTSGSICLYDEVTLSLFSGDTLFARGIGRTDLPSGSTGELIRSLKKLSEIDIKMLYPGHMNTVSDGKGAVRYGLMMTGGMS